MSANGDDEPIRLDTSHRARRRRRASYVVFTVVVTAIVAYSGLEEINGVRGFGMDHAEAHASASGTTLRVKYATVTRGGLATPLSATVERPASATGPVTLAVTLDYFDAFITNGASPQPESESANDADLILVMDEPVGTTLTVDWDMVTRPSGWFTRHPAHMAVLDDAGRPIVRVSFTTDVRP